MSLNPNTPNGLWPVVGTGGSTTPRVRRYTVKGGSVSIGAGDLMVHTDTGTVSAYITASATLGSNVVGVSQHPWTSNSTDRNVWVYDDPAQRFAIQNDSGGNIVFVQSSIGLNFSLLNSGARNTTTMWSKAEIDSSTSNVGFAVATGVSRPLKLVALGRKVGKSTVANSWIECIVQINPGVHMWGKSGIGL